MRGWWASVRFTVTLHAFNAAAKVREVLR